MKAVSTLKTFSNIFATIGIFSWAIFQLSKQKINWPKFIVDNINYFFVGCIVLGLIFEIFSYVKSKDYKSLKQRILFITILFGILALVYFLTK